jgi:hypothetical protein
MLPPSCSARNGFVILLLLSYLSVAPYLLYTRIFLFLNLGAWSLELGAWSREEDFLPPSRSCRRFFLTREPTGHRPVAVRLPIGSRLKFGQALEANITRLLVY